MFTPGPWGISRHHKNGTWPAHYMIGQRDEMYDHAIVLSAEDKGEGKANAYLIAAAPDMYYALINLIDAIAGEQECEIELAKALGNGAPQAIYKARQVISKAEGKSK